MKDLFGNSSVSATLDLPSHLDALVDNLPRSCQLSADELIIKHTMYPFYAPFLTSDKSKQLLDSMKGSNGGSIHSQTGIMASSIRVPQFLRYCPQCIAEDMNKYGEYYWHRLHQIPGVLVCAQHRQPLIDSKVMIPAFNKHEYYPASPEVCGILRISKAYDELFLNQLIRIAQDIEWIVNNIIPAKEENWYRECYIAILKEKGLATTNGRVYQNDFLNSFLNFYSKELLEAIQSPVDRNNSSYWLVSIVRKHRKAFHPLRHILIINYLAGSSKEFFKNNPCYKPFGEAPWLCLNAAAKHYLQPVVTNLNITHCSDTKMPIGTFSCSCGHIYSRRGPDKNDSDRFRYGRIKSFGPVWETKLVSLINQGNLSFREIARQLKVDTYTVIKYSKKSVNPLYFEETDSVFKTKEQLSIKKKDDNRKTWKDLQDKHPVASKTKLRSIEPAVYAWLYRNDKNWLQDNSPKSNPEHRQNNRVDWEERDKNIMQAAKKVVHKEMNSFNRPQRITIRKIGSRIGVNAILDKHLSKLTETKAYLETVCEDVRTFQIRRIKWAACNLNRKGEEPKRWKVLRKAGIRSEYADSFSGLIDHQILCQLNDLVSQVDCFSSMIQL
jgi:hypothetical protein